MKYINKILIGLSFITFLFSSCDKADSLSYYNGGVASVLTSSTNTLAAKPADSLSTILTLNWSNPKYANGDSSTTKYIIEIDSTGRNFAKEYTTTVTGSLKDTFTAKQINDILLNYFKYKIGVTYTLDIRVTSSYANNNNLLLSNTIKVSATAYKIPPKVTPPTTGHLYIVGAATDGGWSNPVPVPTQELTQIDSVTYGGIFNLVGGNEYLLLPLNGDWGNKYSLADKTVPLISGGGSFAYNAKDNFPAPTASGKYKIIVDFQAGTFSVTPFTSVLPDNLFLVGDATPGGWNNPVPVPSQQFTRDNNAQFELTVALTGGKQYLMLPVNGDWSNKFAVADNTIASYKAGGTFGYNAKSNFPGPDASGNYKIVANFLTSTYTVTPQ